MKKQAIVLTSLASALFANQAAFADTQIHPVDYTYSLAVNGDVYPRLRFPGFDSMNGQRVLTRVDVRVQSDVSATIAIENETAAPLTGWSLDGQHLVLTGFERENPKTFGPFAFLGGLFIEPITGTLQPSDGTPRSGPDYLATSLSTTIDSTLDMDSSYLPFFNGGGEVIAVVGPFTEFFLKGATVYDPTLGIGDATVEFTALAQAGTVSVIYEYTTVPEPAGGLALAGVGLLTARNRRRRRR
jgi:hypothetical protein